MAVIMTSTVCENSSTAKPPSSRRNFIRLMDDRLQAESSRNMYSEHGFEALIRAVLMHGFHSFTVVSNCIPGSPHTHADSAMSRIMSRASCLSCGSRLVTERVHHGRPASYACMKSSLTRTLLLEFWKKIEPYASPLNEPS